MAARLGDGNSRWEAPRTHTQHCFLISKYMHCVCASADMCLERKITVGLRDQEALEGLNLQLKKTVFANVEEQTVHYTWKG